MTIEYITTRELIGKKIGKVRILKLSEESDGMIEISCPDCGFSDKRKEKWNEPFVEGSGSNQKFNVVCKKCGFSTKLLRLKKEAKKKK